MCILLSHYSFCSMTFIILIWSKNHECHCLYTCKQDMVSCVPFEERPQFCECAIWARSYGKDTRWKDRNNYKKIIEITEMGIKTWLRNNKIETRDHERMERRNNHRTKIRWDRQMKEWKWDTIKKKTPQINRTKIRWHERIKA